MSRLQEHGKHSIHSAVTNSMMQTDTCINGEIDFYKLHYLGLTPKPAEQHRTHNIEGDQDDEYIYKRINHFVKSAKCTKIDHILMLGC